MNANRRHLFTLLAMGILALGVALALSVGASGSPAAHALTMNPSRRLDPRDAATVAKAGTRVLVYVAEARGAIRAKDADRAREEVRKAGRLLNKVRSALPTAIVKDRIWVARTHLEYEEAQEVVPDLVPIDRELAFLQGFVPTAEARSHLENARRLLESGDTPAGLDELEKVEAALVYEEVDLPLAETEAHLSKALAEVAIGGTEKADLALRSAEESAQRMVDAAKGPLGKDSSAHDPQAQERVEGK